MYQSTTPNNACPAKTLRVWFLTSPKKIALQTPKTTTKTVLLTNPQPLRPTVSHVGQGTSESYRCWQYDCARSACDLGPSSASVSSCDLRIGHGAFAGVYLGAKIRSKMSKWFPSRKISDSAEVGMEASRVIWKRVTGRELAVEPSIIH